GIRDKLVTGVQTCALPILEFVIECRTDRHMDEATVVIELTDGAESDDVCRSIGDQLRTTLGVRIECRAVPTGTLPRPELKAKRLDRKSVVRERVEETGVAV